MSEQELNKKLAEWAGFEKREGVKTFRKEGGTLYTEVNVWWLTPKIGRYRGEWECLPDFTQSLDACFRWLVPKLENYTLQLADNGHLAYAFAKTHRQFGIGKIPALALCLAIEELIDKEKLNGNKSQ